MIAGAFENHRQKTLFLEPGDDLPLEFAAGERGAQQPVGQTFRQVSEMQIAAEQDIVSAAPLIGVVQVLDRLGREEKAQVVAQQVREMRGKEIGRKGPVARGKSKMSAGHRQRLVPGPADILRFVAVV